MAVAMEASAAADAVKVDAAAIEQPLSCQACSRELKSTKNIYMAFDLMYCSQNCREQGLSKGSLKASSKLR